MSGSATRVKNGNKKLSKSWLMTHCVAVLLAVLKNVSLKHFSADFLRSAVSNRPLADSPQYQTGLFLKTVNRNVIRRIIQFEYDRNNSNHPQSKCLLHYPRQKLRIWTNIKSHGSKNLNNAQFKHLLLQLIQW